MPGGRRRPAGGPARAGGGPAEVGAELRVGLAEVRRELKEDLREVRMELKSDPALARTGFAAGWKQIVGLLEAGGVITRGEAERN